MTTSRTLPAGVWTLGFVSMFMDISSEMVHGLLPIFMATVLGTSIAAIGVIEGVAEGFATFTRVFSGALSDRLRGRKPLLLVGYGLAAVTKPVFPLATSIGWVFAARFIDRIGKGIRGAPRDALIADITPSELRGAAYGLRQSLDSVGAFVGPALAVLFMGWLADDIQAVLWIAVVPAVLSVALLFAGVREPRADGAEARARRLPAMADAKRLSHGYWQVVALGAVFTLARFSEAFLVLRAFDVGLGAGYAPVVMIVMNVVYAAAAFPAGALADRFSRRWLLIAGMSLLAVADLVLAAAADATLVMTGAVIWGLHMAITQGLFSKLVADTAPVDLRGTAFGVYSLASGGALLAASVIAGALWSAYGPSATFLAGAGFALAAMLGLLVHRTQARDAGR